MRCKVLLSVLTPLAPLGLLAAAPVPAQAQTLTVENFVGRIEVRTGDYDAIEARVVDGENAGDARVDTRSDGGVAVDGGVSDWEGVSCRGSGRGMEMRVAGDLLGLAFGGFQSIQDYPLLEVTAPAGVTVDIAHSVLVGEIGAIAAGDIRHGGCGALSIGDVAGDFSAGQAGSGSLQVGDVAGRLNADLAGSGDLRAGDVGGGLDVALAGSGDVQIGRVTGGARLGLAGSGDITLASASGDDVDIRLAGSGDVEIGAGQAGVLSVNINGSGDVDFGGAAQQARIRIAGSGDVTAGAVDDSDIRISGSGEVHMDGARIH